MQIISVTQKHHNIGYALYMGGHPLSTCQNAMQIAGWWSALEADAECATPGYAAKAGF